MMEGGSSEMIFVYNGQRDADKELLAYVSFFSDKVKKIDVQKGAITKPFLIDMVNKLGVEFQDLVDHDCPDLLDIEYHLYLTTQEQYLDLVLRKPTLIKTPVLVLPNRAFFVNDKSDVLQMSFF